MSSLNESIKFYLNIEDPNIIFSDYFKKWINGKYHNLYLAELIQPYCPYYHSSNLKQNGHYTSKRKILSALTEDRSMTGIASIDRFHMVQMLTRSFNIFRVQIMKQFNKSSREYRLLKSPWILYLMKYDKLNRTTPYYDWHFKDYLTQEHVVLDGLDCDQTLENTYWVMQDFMVAIQNNDEKKVIHLLHSKQTVGKQMHQTLLTFKRNYSGVLNGISSTYSNGCLEGVNRKIKQIERTAYGYRNFSHLLIRLEENIVKEKESSNFFFVA